MRLFRALAGLGLAVPIVLLADVPPAHARKPACERTITADVVVLDQPIMFNRLGAQNVNAIVYALARDVINVDSRLPLTMGGQAIPGRVALRPDKRPRPLVLRMAEGDCLEVHFQNLLTPQANPNSPPITSGDLVFRLQTNDQVAGRWAGFHPQGLQLVDSIHDDASFVGRNGNGLVPPGGGATYTFYGEEEGGFLVTSYGATFGGEGSAANAPIGMFAVINVEPKRADFFRSQVTEEEMRLATRGVAPTGQPILDYYATYPNDCPHGVWCLEGKAGLPILRILTPANEIVYGDLNAIIVGPLRDGRFPADTYPLESVGKTNPSLPDRLRPFREFTVAFHDEVAAAQAFPGFFLDPVFSHTLASVRDNFMINYGAGGIGAEIIANRLRVGPMHDCLDCSYEEFFLSSFTVGDPAMLVDVPANVGLENVGPGEAPPSGAVGPKATRAFFPDDPSNVHHVYMGDKVKFRNLHTGKEAHVFHLHNHQWLFNPNDDDSNYIDSQGLGPGSNYTYEITFNGAGNRNRSPGDSIFHCHFYPHFAQGMWELMRTHDVFEQGTRLLVSGSDFHDEPFELQDGTPAPGARALPDGEIVAGTPIPAVVPIPGQPMAPMPGAVEVVPNPNQTVASIFRAENPGAIVPTGSNARVIDRDVNPGYPFFIAGIEHTVGQRATTPPLDMLTEAQAQELASGANPLFAGRHELVALAGGFDGGLPRHTLEGYAAGGEAISTVTRLDFTKEIVRARPVYFPEEGTDVEQTAMRFHAERVHPSTAVFLNGTYRKDQFVTNGMPPVPSGVYGDPCLDDAGNPLVAGQQARFFDGNGGLGLLGQIEYGTHNPRVYKAAVIQTDAVFNKVGYHFPQQRILALWEDVFPTLDKMRPPEPLVIRFNTFDCGKYLHTNLVPSHYELDDYQVRTPTDVIAQHIHLPKWDLTTTDGGANGWNYEDGTLSPEAVRERIAAINEYNATSGTPVATLDGRTFLSPQPHPFFGAGPDGDWLGARITIQRWFWDPIVNVRLVHRGHGITFTHDHLGSSTHQQVGLYASVLTEPPGSTWRHNETGELLGTRPDGGPTSWQAAILTGDLDGDGENDSHREFWFQASDFQHAYEKGVYVGAGPDGRPDPSFAPTPDSFRYAINPSVREQSRPLFPDMMVNADICPGGVPRPCPEAISAEDPGMFVMNYRNEPVALRVYDPDRRGPDGKRGTQATGARGDLAFALQTRTDRAIPQLNTRLGDTPYPPLTDGILPGDPFTPILRTYATDRIRVKVQMGGQEEEFNSTIHAMKWLQGGSGFGKAPNSGWRNSQYSGISEQFTFSVPLVPMVSKADTTADYAFTMNTSQDGWWSGVWTVIRAYNESRRDLYRLPSSKVPVRIENARQFIGPCPRNAPVRRYDVTAILASDALPNDLDVTIVPRDASATMHEGGPLDSRGGTLVFNPRRTRLDNGRSGPLHDPTAILFVHTSDLDGRNRLRSDKPIEPLILRANAGECIEVTLRNRLPNKMPDLAGLTRLLGVVNRDRFDSRGVTTFNNNLIRPSSYVGLHPQLVAYDVTDSDGAVVGINPANQIVAPGRTGHFRWYAGDVDMNPAHRKAGWGNRISLVATPIEFGGVNLTSADKIKQGQKGLFGGLIVMPKGSFWKEDSDTRTSATIDGRTRDFAVIASKQMNHRYADGTAVESIGVFPFVIGDDSQDTGQAAVNYGSEPLWFRFGLRANAPFANVPGGLGAVPNAHEAYANARIGGRDPVTPVFRVKAGAPFRMHVLHPHGGFRGTSFNLHGHVWQQDPYVCPGEADFGLPGKCLPHSVPSRALGENPISHHVGGQSGILPYAHFVIVAPSAGGRFAVPGDYLFRDQAGFGNLMGIWGILRVGDAPGGHPHDPFHHIGLEKISLEKSAPEGSGLWSWMK